MQIAVVISGVLLTRTQPSILVIRSGKALSKNVYSIKKNELKTKKALSSCHFKLKQGIQLLLAQYLYNNKKGNDAQCSNRLKIAWKARCLGLN